MKRKRLLTPPTLRFPDVHEFPKGYNAAKLKKEYDQAQIVPGYKIMLPETPQVFKFFATCNVNIGEVWDALLALAKLVPDESKGVIGVKEESPFFGKPNEKSMILKQFQKYELELLGDPFLEFGIASADEKNFSEVFITCPKYINFWGSDLKAFKAVMKKLGLTEKKELRFIDEFPLISEALPPPARPYRKVFESLQDLLT